MTVRDVLVQIGFLMVTTGAMLAVWAILTGQFSRMEPEEATPAEPADDDPEAEFEIPPIRRRNAPPRAAKARPVKAKTKPAKAKAAKPKTAKRRASKPRPPA